MNTLHDLLASVWVQRTGWVLVHSFWQLATVAVVAGLVLALLRNRSPQLRYLAACSAMGLVCLLPVATWCWLSDAPNETQLGVATGLPEAVSDMVPASVAALPKAYPRADPSAVAVQPVQSTAVSGTVESSSDQVKASLFRERWSAWLPHGVMAWLLGVSLLAIRNLGGWMTAQRFRYVGTSPVDTAAMDRLDALIERMGLTRPVRMLSSSLVDMPLVVGSLRPVVLMPLAVLTGLTPRQLDAIIAHELAHIRRHDYLVNLLQTFAETLLFYHPAVWWISRRIRAEREICCDDAAVAVCDNKVVYAEALTAVARHRAEPALAMGAAQGGVLYRVRRVLGQGDRESWDWRRSFGGSLAALATVALLVGCLAYAEESNPEQQDASDKHETGKAVDESAAAEVKAVEVETAGGRLKFDEPIPIEIRIGAGGKENVARLHSITFRKTDEQLQARIAGTISSAPKSLWDVTVDLLDEKERVLQSRVHVFENTGFISVQPIAMDRKLDLSFGPLERKFEPGRDPEPWRSLNRAVHFRVRIRELPELSKTGPLEFDKIIPLELASGAGGQIPPNIAEGVFDEARTAKLAWVRFRETEDRLWADVRTVMGSLPKGRWRVQVVLFESDGRSRKPVATGSTVFENSGVLMYTPVHREGDLRISLTRWEMTRKAKRFGITFSRAPSDHEVTAQLVPVQSKNPAEP